MCQVSMTSFNPLNLANLILNKYQSRKEWLQMLGHQGYMNGSKKTKIRFPVLQTNGLQASLPPHIQTLLNPSLEEWLDLVSTS